MVGLLDCASELLLAGRYDGIRFEPPAAVLAGWYCQRTAARRGGLTNARTPHAPPRPALSVDARPRAADLEETNDTCGGQMVYRFVPRNRWLFSHQPGLWRVDRLRAFGSAGPNAAGENPWLNELRGSRRAADSSATIGLVVRRWFASVSSGGVLNAVGRAMVERERTCDPF